MSDHFGVKKRDKIRLTFRHGFDGQQSTKLKESLHIYGDSQIRSGMIISKFYNSANQRYEWKIGLIAGATPFIAEQDYDEFDVRGAGGVLTGYNLSSEIEVLTGWVVLGTEANWDDDKPVTAIAEGQNNAGCITLATTNDPIIGYLSGGHKDGLLNLADQVSNVVKTNGKVPAACFTARYSPNLKAA